MLYRYEVDEVHYVDELESFFASFGNDLTILTLSGTNTDSGLQTLDASFDGMSKFTLDKSTLHAVMAELRVIKTEMELDALRYSAKVTCEAHKHVMRKVKSGQMVR